MYIDSSNRQAKRLCFSTIVLVVNKKKPNIHSVLCSLDMHVLLGFANPGRYIDIINTIYRSNKRLLQCSYLTYDTEVITTISWSSCEKNTTKSR